MDPTRPSDSAPVQQAQTPRVTDAAKANQARAAVAERQADDVAESVELSADALEVGRAEVARLDDARLDAIRQAVQSGNYGVDADALADRLLDDAFGD